MPEFRSWCDRPAVRFGPGSAIALFENSWTKVDDEHVLANSYVMPEEVFRRAFRMALGFAPLVPETWEEVDADARHAAPSDQ